MRLTLFFLLLIGLTACSTTPQMPEPMGLSYLMSKPLRVNVSRIEVVKQYRSSSEPPHIENDLPIPPVAMIQQWAQDRLLPTGTTGYLVVTIEDASVTEKSKTRKSDGSFFGTNKLELYEVKLSVKIELFDEGEKSKGYAYAHASGTYSIPTNYTLGQRRKFWIHMMEKTMNQLDQELDQNIHKHLERHLEILE